MRPRIIAFATLCTTLLGAFTARAQFSVAWITQYGTAAFEGSAGIVVDATGQGWITGYTFGNLGGSGNAGGEDFFLTHVSPTGSILSTAQRGSSADEEATGISLLGDTDLVIVVEATGPLDNRAYNGGGDTALIRYTAAGIWQNTVITGGPAYDVPFAVAANSTNVFTAGASLGSYASQTNVGNYDAVITKTNAAGTPIWTRFLGTTGDDRAYGAAVDSSGNSYIAGFTSGALPGATFTGAQDYFVARYDPAGNRTLLVEHGTASYEDAHAIKVDAIGNIYLTGYTEGNLDGQANKGHVDAYLTKLDSAGNVLWTRLFGGSGYEFAYTLDLDSSGNPWIGGTSDSTFGTHINAGSYDGFVAAYDPSGNFLGSQFFSTNGDDGVRSLASFPGGGVEVTGFTAGALTHPNAGGGDIFVAKVVPEPGSCSLLLGALGGFTLRRKRRANR